MQISLMREILVINGGPTQILENEAKIWGMCEASQTQRHMYFSTSRNTLESRSNCRGGSEIPIVLCDFLIKFDEGRDIVSDGCEQ